MLNKLALRSNLEIKYIVWFIGIADKFVGTNQLSKLARQDSRRHFASALSLGLREIKIWVSSAYNEVVNELERDLQLETHTS